MRLIEISFYELSEHMRQVIPNEGLYVFLEAFCRSLNIEYTSVITAYDYFYNVLKPTKGEKCIFAIKADIRLKDIGIDYRTIRKYREKYEAGTLQLYPNISHHFIHEALRQFIVYFGKMFNPEYGYAYIFAMKGGFDRELRSDTYN